VFSAIGGMGREATKFYIEKEHSIPTGGNMG